ncbi:hypothetical protein ACTZQ7_23560, partial [Klebsiella pneumoniae]
IATGTHLDARHVAQADQRAVLRRFQILISSIPAKAATTLPIRATLGLSPTGQIQDQTDDHVLQQSLSLNRMAG